MMIDAHLHLWSLASGDYAWNTPALGPVHASFGPDDASAALASGDVTGAVLVQAADTDRDTLELLRVARSSAAADAWALGVVAWVPLESPGEAERRLDGWRLLGEPIVGIRQLIHDDPRDDVLDRAPVRETLRLLAAHRLPLDVPDAWPRLWPALTRVADAMPSLRIVVDHLGKPESPTPSWRAAVADLARRPNVFAKISGLGQHTREAADVALEAFGADRLMWGGDWPVSLTAGTYADTAARGRAVLAALASDEREALESGTASRVYHVGVPA